jgi:enoyl-[acyl-carrier protein] reductase I
VSATNTSLDEAEKKNPLRRNVIIEEVGNTTAFPCSDLASGITGDIVHVDSGYHILGMV